MKKKLPKASTDKLTITLFVVALFLFGLSKYGEFFPSQTKPSRAASSTQKPDLKQTSDKPSNLNLKFNLSLEYFNEINKSGYQNISKDIEKHFKENRFNMTVSLLDWKESDNLIGENRPHFYFASTSKVLSFDGRYISDIALYAEDNCSIETLFFSRTENAISIKKPKILIFHHGFVSPQLALSLKNNFPDADVRETSQMDTFQASVNSDQFDIYVTDGSKFSSKNKTNHSLEMVVKNAQLKKIFSVDSKDPCRTLFTTEVRDSRTVKAFVKIKNNSQHTFWKSLKPFSPEKAAELTSKYLNSELDSYKKSIKKI